MDSNRHSSFSCAFFNEMVQAPPDRAGQERYESLRKQEKKVSVQASECGGMGLFAEEDINRNELVLEYKGERISGVERNKREAEYRRQGKGSEYIMELLVDELYLDGAGILGNHCKFANHSCSPNCEMVLECYEPEGKMEWCGAFLYSTKKIRKGMELTFEYNWKVSGDEPLTICECQSRRCRGFVEKFIN